MKESLRLRRLRSEKRNGLRGIYANFFDGVQGTQPFPLHSSLPDDNTLNSLIGWLLVTVIGFATAVVAYAIISSEMLLFDLKSGYCSNGWRLPKRFCCRASLSTPETFNHYSLVLLGGQAVREKLEGRENGEGCQDWRSWGSLYYNLPDAERILNFVDYASYIVRIPCSFIVAQWNRRNN